ncbi:MAG: class I SAM-dependent methyltransferase [bacterium]|nr:class I SAM-dependent methyltransferase [bacterium]
MKQVVPITIDEFKKKYNVKENNPWKTSVFTREDLLTLQKEAGVVGAVTQTFQLVKLLPVFVRNPWQFIRNLPVLIQSYVSRVIIYYQSRHADITLSCPFSDYTMRASIFSSFKPRTFLEIGTGKGWGIVAFKAVLPTCHCYTVSPKLSPETGKMVKEKNLGIQQIWEDSAKLNFKQFGKVDVTYIDGNHTYEWVYSDLVHSAAITKKAIILDDYIPSPDSLRGNIARYAEFNADVVRAVHTYLRTKPNEFKYAYWLIDSNLCVLIK